MGLISIPLTAYELVLERIWTQDFCPRCFWVLKHPRDSPSASGYKSAKSIHQMPVPVPVFDFEVSEFIA